MWHNNQGIWRLRIWDGDVAINHLTVTGLIPNVFDIGELITSKTMDTVNLKTGRVVVYKHTSLVAKVREDLMSDKFSSIWLEVGFPGKAKILVCNLYREWQYLGQSDHSSLEISEQMSRWLIFLEQWEKALDTG